MTARLKHQQGVTLVELILSMVIISVALTGILSVMNLTVAHSADPIVQHQALAIAESYLEEITLQAYSGSVCTTCSRADYDDVDDYQHLPDTSVRDRLGLPIPSLSQYSVTVAVAAPTALAGNINAKQITVTVSGPGLPGLTLTGYKAQD